MSATPPSSSDGATALPSDYSARFGGIGRLFGSDSLERLHRAHVCVVGIGGVGSWAVEALARSGVGSLTLVDLDDICTTNVNRQIHALNGTVGAPKVEAMAERIRAINPTAQVNPVHAFFNEATAAVILTPQFDFVLDAIDNPPKKALLIARCRERELPVLVMGGAGGRRDPLALRTGDLAHSSHDRLLTAVRSALRKDHGFPVGEKKRFGIDCLYSPEPVMFPQSDGTVCPKREDGSTLRLDCERGYGTACFVTGAFGLAAAAHIVGQIVDAGKPV